MIYAIWWYDLYLAVAWFIVFSNFRRFLSHYRFFPSSSILIDCMPHFNDVLTTEKGEKNTWIPKIIINSTKFIRGIKMHAAIVIERVDGRVGHQEIKSSPMELKLLHLHGLAFECMVDFNYYSNWCENYSCIWKRKKFVRCTWRATCAFASMIIHRPFNAHIHSAFNGSFQSLISIIIGLNIICCPFKFPINLGHFSFLSSNNNYKKEHCEHGRQGKEKKRWARNISN